MKISGRIVGTTVGPRRQTIDARWLMAYAAALGETAAEYLDTTRPDGVLAHPLFPVCYEWPLARMIRAKTLKSGMAARSVHATHDLTLHRRPRAGDRLSTTASIIAVEARRPGAYVVTRFKTVDAEGGPVTTSDYGSIYRGVECENPVTSESPTLAEAAPSVEGPRDPDWSGTVPIGPTLAHVYTECARIWNPIHTDKAVARAAGLPDIILHGTATLALAVSKVLQREALGPGAPVTRIACRFGGMVELPSAITVMGWVTALTGNDRLIAFQAVTPDGRAAVRDGRLLVTDSNARTENAR